MRSKLAFLAAACVLPIAIVAMCLVYLHAEHEQSEERDDAISRARAIVSALDREFARTESALLALSTAPRLAAHDLGGFQDQATRALAHIEADSIVVLDRSGQMLLHTARAFGTPLPALTKAPLLQRILASGKPGVSDLYRGPLSSTPIFTIGVPVDGDAAYSLYATTSPAHLAPILAEQKLPSSWRAAIADSSGSVVARTHDIQKFLGKKVHPDLLQRLGQSSEGAFAATTLDGIAVVTAYSRSQTSGWTVVLGIPISATTAGIRHTLSWLLAATGGALSIGLILAWILGGRIARAIGALVAPARALGSGRMVSVPAPHFREADQVGQALLEAAVQLQRSQYEALHDALTGMSNRKSFHQSVRQQLALCQRNDTRLAILFIDLDGFKAVNDTYGHPAGDALLRSVAARLRDAIRHSDIAARLGGDEFAIALIDSDLANAEAFAVRLIELISAPYHLGEIEARISASIGVAGYPGSPSDCDTLIRYADQAMYRAKAKGKHRVCVAAA